MEDTLITHKYIFSKALVDVKFAKNVFSKIPVNTFGETEQNKELAKIINRYYITNSKPLDLATFAALIENKAQRDKIPYDESKELLERANNLYNIEDFSEKEVLRANVEEYIRKTLAVETLSQTLLNKDLGEDGVLEDLAEELFTISAFDTKGAGDGLSFDFFTEIKEKRIDLYDNMIKDTLPTGLANVDAILSGGGLSYGEVGMIIAPTGYGKSSSAIQLATNAVKQGFNALYLTLEEQAVKIISRLELNLIGQSMSWLIDGHSGKTIEEHSEMVNKFYEQNPDFGELFIEKRNPHEVDINELEQIIIDWKVKTGTKIDVVIIDYPEIMKLPNSNRESVDEMGQLFERIRGLAERYQFVCWTLAQTNRTAFSADVITSHNIQGAHKVTNAVELVLTMNRKQIEFENNCFRFHVSKVRNPAQGVVRPEFLYFRIHPDKGYQIVPETEQEILVHNRLLNEGAEENMSQYRNSKQETVDPSSKVGDLNNLIQRGI